MRIGSGYRVRIEEMKKRICLYACLENQTAYWRQFGPAAIQSAGVMGQKRRPFGCLCPTCPSENADFCIVGWDWHTRELYPGSQTEPCLIASTQVSKAFHVALNTDSLPTTLPQGPHLRRAQERIVKVTWHECQRTQLENCQNSIKSGTGLKNQKTSVTYYIMPKNL